MDAYLCRTCGVQFAPAERPPDSCPVCTDERQYVGPHGQQWTTLGELAAQGYRSVLRPVEPDLLGIGVEPQFGIGQRALLVPTPSGGVLWDPPGFLDDAAVEAVRARGGLVAVSASHPHFYGAMIEWSDAFGGVPVLLPEADLRWVMRPDPAIETWSGTRGVVPGVTLVQCGGHFAGSAVLHWAAGDGVLLTGDTISVAADRRWVSFMRSYPNYLPLPESAVRAIVDRLRPYPFARLHGGWWGTQVAGNGEEAVRRSADRYVRWLRGEERDDAG